MRQKITERTLTRKAPGEVWDEYLPGFGLRIGKKRKTFFVMTRIDGKQRRITVGNAAILSLADARDKARGIMRNAARGIDPQEAERAAKREALLARRDTFRAVSEAYMTEKGQHLKSGGELQRKLDKAILPALGDLAVTDIRRADIKAFFLEKAETTPVQANRLLALIRVILNFAVDEELIDNNPAIRIERRPETPRDRYLSAAEIKVFWRGLDAAKFDPQIVRILKLCLVTGQRRAEVAHMRWSELDLAGAKWELPAARTKAKRPHRVPLSALALDLIGEPTGGDYVFTNGGGRPFHLNAPGQAMAASLPVLGLADNPATPHDLRRSFASGMGDLGIPPYVVSRLLNHAMAGVTERVYYLTALAGEKERAMDAWGAKLTEIVSGEAAPSNVSRLKRA